MCVFFVVGLDFFPPLCWESGQEGWQSSLCRAALNKLGSSRCVLREPGMLRACGIDPVHSCFRFVLIFIIFFSFAGVKYSHGMLAFVKIQVVVSAE